jgi:hypothetical protein
MTIAGAIVIILAMLLIIVSAMAVQYAIYITALRKGRDWHPPRQPKRPFWL